MNIQTSYESSRPQLPVVARLRWWHTGTSSKLLNQSGCTEVASSCTTPSVEVAWESLAMDSHWFSWKRQAVFFSCHRQAFKMVGSVSYVIHYFIKYHWGFKRVICCIWTPRRACFRHWTSNCVKRIQSVLGVKWDQTHSFILNQMEQQRV